MQLLAPVTVLLVTLTSTSLAYPTVQVYGNAPKLNLRQESAPDAPAEGTSSSNTPSNATGSSSGSAISNNTSNNACSSEILALAAGIQSNIDDQNNELTTVNALGMVLAQSPMDMTLYGATQTSLMGFVTKGISIREGNQKLAPPDNGAIPGLAKVAMAQMEELNLTMSLAMPPSGVVNISQANGTVETLKKDFAGGMVQNKANLEAATSGCRIPNR
ncbi:hypothetical protein WAI453_000061 [Rhynchosporium graminicola]